MSHAKTEANDFVRVSNDSMLTQCSRIKMQVAIYRALLLAQRSFPEIPSPRDDDIALGAMENARYEFKQREGNREGNSPACALACFAKKQVYRKLASAVNAPLTRTIRRSGGRER